ncbi:MAG: DUF2066 domain-containing protein [Gammaproteobacteria bacterium]
MLQRVRITDHRQQCARARRAAGGPCLAVRLLAGGLLAGALVGGAGPAWAAPAEPAEPAAGAAGVVVVPLSLPVDPAAAARDAAAEAAPQLDTALAPAPAADPQAARVADAAALYDVAVPVADQSDSARRQGGRAALGIVLMRLTGLGDLPPSEALALAQRDPERLFARFGYQSGQPAESLSGVERPDADPAAPRLMLRVTFSPPALFQLIREARLPIWPSARPRMRIWLFVDAGGAQYNLGERVQEPALAAAIERAAQWGLPTWFDPTPALTEASPAIDAEPPQSADAGFRASQSIALRPALAPGGPVRPVIGVWSASRDDLAALSTTSGSGFDAVLRLRGPAQTSMPADTAGGVPVGGPMPEPTSLPVSTTTGIALVSETGSVMGAGAGVPATVPLARVDAAAASTAVPPAAPVLLTHDAATIWQGTLDIYDPAPPTAAIAAADLPDSVDNTASDTPAQALATAYRAAAAPIDLGAGPATALATAAVDRLVAHLLTRFQVAPGTQGTLSVQVAGIRSVADYAEVLRRLAAVEVIDDVRVAGAAGNRVEFRITTGALVAQLAAVLGTDGRLRPPETPDQVPEAGPVPDLALEWQGG